jgi:hypothetical protein
VDLTHVIKMDKIPPNSNRLSVRSFLFPRRDIDKYKVPSKYSSKFLILT